MKAKKRDKPSVGKFAPQLMPTPSGYTSSLPFSFEQLPRWCVSFVTKEVDFFVATTIQVTMGKPFTLISVTGEPQKRHGKNDSTAHRFAIHFILTKNICVAAKHCEKERPCFEPNGGGRIRWRPLVRLLKRMKNAHFRSQVRRKGRRTKHLQPSGMNKEANRNQSKYALHRGFCDAPKSSQLLLIC